ncbi:unnamed protein product [Chilo suppressalis]|uniref:Thioredoxin domain-containing protein n=1 Tax=Chilo suppressalis TaxID=168631 RepID=A0ABN8B4M3_CHISP|nr:unnamed protein product [Chilo suppressalis]
MEQIIHQVAQNVEKQLDKEIERLDALDSSDLEAIRQQRIAEMKQQAKRKQEWIANNVDVTLWRDACHPLLAADIQITLDRCKNKEKHFPYILLCGVPIAGAPQFVPTASTDLRGHGEYTEIDGEKEFFAICNKSTNVVCHFYRNDSPRCKIVDMHLKILCKKHVEARFVKLDAERAPFLTASETELYVSTQRERHGESASESVRLSCNVALFWITKWRLRRLKIRVIPTIAIVKDNKTKDFIVGFTELGNRDDFNTEMLEWRLARGDVIDYSGDLLHPPEEKKKSLHIQKKGIRDSTQDDDSDDFSD